MKVIKPYYDILTKINGFDILRQIEKCGRVCYKSNDKINEISCYDFVRNIIKRGHESVLEHFSFSVKFVCDRGVSHEIVRHRLASYSQESTRYCNYSLDKFGNEITVVEPYFFNENEKFVWYNSCLQSERSYFELLQLGCTPQEARSVLPTSLKTELIMTANLREWRHFLKLRTAKNAHPQIRELAIPLLKDLQERIPVLFDYIEIEDD